MKKIPTLLGREKIKIVAKETLILLGEATRLILAGPHIELLDQAVLASWV